MLFGTRSEIESEDLCGEVEIDHYLTDSVTMVVPEDHPMIESAFERLIPS